MNLKNLRENLNLSQKEIASKLCLKITTYWGYENGTRQMDYETLIKIADFFGCSIDYLLGHQTNGVVYVDGFTEPQQKLLKLIPQLNYEQSIFLLGRITEMLDLPYSSTKPVKPR